MSQPEIIPVPLNVVEGVIKYLLTRPMGEIEAGVHSLRQAIHDHRQAQEKRERLDQPLDPAQQRAVDGVLGDPEE